MRKEYDVTEGEIVRRIIVTRPSARSGRWMN